MDKINTTITTGEPVTEQAPTVDTPSTSSTPTTSGLPAGYLSEGYHATTARGENYLRSEYVGKYAEAMASLLSGMASTDFKRLLREMKRNKKKTLPFEARQTAVAEQLPTALSLVSRKKAPAILVDFIKANLNHIYNDDDWTAYYRHLEAIAGYLIGGDT